MRKGHPHRSTFSTNADVRPGLKFGYPDIGSLIMNGIRVACSKSTDVVQATT